MPETIKKCSAERRALEPAGGRRMVSHIYKSVTCKSCGARMDIEYLGPARNVRIAGTIRHPGQIRCMKCGESHPYKESDTQLSVKDQSPSRKR